MEIKDIYELWDRFEGSTALELEVEVGGGRLHLRRDAGNRGAAGYQNAMSRDDMPFGAMDHNAMHQNSIKSSAENYAAGDQIYSGKEYSARNAQTEANPDSHPQTAWADHKADGMEKAEKTITAPLVGTFYRGSEPGGEPFVKEGQQVKKGDRLCIIEAMKLMNEVTASEDGEILKISAEDGSLVEYGETLFVLG